LNTASGGSEEQNSTGQAFNGVNLAKFYWAGADFKHLRPGDNHKRNDRLKAQWEIPDAKNE